MLLEINEWVLVTLAVCVTAVREYWRQVEAAVWYVRTIVRK